MSEEIWICPDCGKEYGPAYGLSGKRRLSAHLTGYHNYKGAKYKDAMKRAVVKK